MKKAGWIPLLAALLLLTGCAAAPPAGDGGAQRTYAQITQEEAKSMMAEDDGCLVVDVRRQDEFDAGHIPGAVCVPNESIGAEAPAALPDRGQLLLVYCRSGNRSKQAAQKLADLGYTRVCEFGGILDWTGEIVTTEEENTGDTAGALGEDTVSARTEGSEGT